MADYAKRPEVTISTMGKVHNPTGEGVRAMSAQVQAKALKHSNSGTNGSSNGSADAPPIPSVVVSDDHETKTKEGTAKRNITRKKTDPRDTGNYDSRNKKQGGHGKGQWKDDVILDDEVVPLDEKDPLFDETKELPYVLSSHEDPHSRNFDPTEGLLIVGPMLTESEFKIQVQEILQEFFDSCDTDEVIRSIEELQCKEYHPDVVKKAISISLDRHPRERELISRLLTCLHPSPLKDRDMEDGFDILLDSLDDLSTDVPEARTMVANFLARAVVDEVLPPAFLSDQNNKRPGELVIEKAISLLSREHCTARLERVWGPGDGRPIEELKVAMDQMLQEYLLSRELDECARCVKELDAAHYMHELVKRGVKIAMEQDGKDSSTQHEKSSIDAMAALFGFLVKNAIISEYQVAKGVDRLHRILDDLKLDVPAASTLLNDFETLLREELPALVKDEKKE
ncbi:MA3 domain containing protein [Nitzschia inconspicua]|uniref:MA3 domain containing protein n=1 Tax=Nitzschia inconspicua TaxID=303405 RepID=A0A9K3L256_9STRA|nr:MA3 domain containing protein [Nitzschia inconspicua]KAG7353992.1 MA3 domain containing protein [Nitzschia inconspicua]